MGKSGILSRIHEYERQRDYTQAEIADAEKKISDLEEVYGYVHTLKDNVNHVKKQVGKMDSEYDGVWKGYNANAAYESVDEGQVHTSYSDYEKSLDELMETINNDIYAQRTIRNQKYGILEGILNFLGSLWIEFENAVD